MLPSHPPKYASWSEMLSSIKQGETGWRAYAVQRVVGVAPDGVFGPITNVAVKTWQRANGLVADGIVGPATQAKMLKTVAAKVEKEFKRLPAGLLDGFARVEGANILAATNWYTPPGGKPGVDCGPVQWRQYGPPFSPMLLMDAFDPTTAFTYAARAFTNRILDYAARNSKLSSHMIVQAAVLAHNAPFMAEQIVKYGKLSTPSAVAVWTVIPLDERSKYGGREHYTHAEWAYEYPARVLRGVSY